MTFRLKAGIIFSVIVVVAVTSAFRYFTAHRDALAISARVLDKVPDFTLLDHNGSIRNLHSYAKSKTVILSGYSNLCASASGVLRAMPETLKSLRARNVQLLFISTDSAAERIKMIDATFVAQTDVSILLDTSGIVSKTLSFTGFGDTVVIEPPQWKVKYRGDLPGALKAAGLNGGMGELQACTLPSLQFTNVSYAREVAPLIAEKCLNCHSPGRKFRPVLNSYEKVRNWSAKSPSAKP
ncbi:MAG: peroxiredoxin family protein [Bdellovibrionales bacterium]